MLITSNSFFSASLNTVDRVIGDFVNHAYVNFIQENAGVITSIFTLYIMFMGYQFLSHSQSFNLNDVVKRIVVMLCVYGFIMNWRLYHLFVYNIFTNEPASLTKSLIGSVSGRQDIASALDNIYSCVIDAVLGFFGEVNFSATGLTFILYGLLVFIVGTLMCVFALLLFIYAKMMMAVSLALGPIFLLFILWEPTKGLFNSWLSKLITIALIPIITSAILVLMLSVINVTLPGMTKPAEDMQFVGIAPFLGLCLTTNLILSQVFRISSALGGGITLSSLSAGANIASSALERSGAVALTRHLFGARKYQGTQYNASKNQGGHHAKQFKRILPKGK